MALVTVAINQSKFLSDVAAANKMSIPLRSLYSVTLLIYAHEKPAARHRSLRGCRSWRVSQKVVIELTTLYHSASSII